MIVDYFILKNKKNDSNNHELWTRSFLKSLSWRVLGTLDTILISYIIIGNFSSALSIGGVELVTKMFLYVFHERLWVKIKWGRK